MYLSNTALFDGGGMCRIYYIKYYMFRHLTMAIFRSWKKYLVSNLMIIILFWRRNIMYLSNTTLFDGGGMCRIYYIKYNYMFRHLTMAIFRLWKKYLLSSLMIIILFWRRDIMCLSNTTLFDGGGMCRIYYIKYNCMFRHLTMAIFRLWKK